MGLIVVMVCGALSVGITRLARSSIGCSTPPLRALRSSRVKQMIRGIVCRKEHPRPCPAR